MDRESFTSYCDHTKSGLVCLRGETSGVRGETGHPGSGPVITGPTLLDSPSQVLGRLPIPVGVPRVDYDSCLVDTTSVSYPSLQGVIDVHLPVPGRIPYSQP